LGIDRADEPGQQALEHGYGFATRSDAPGRALTDYHTAQVPAAKRGVTYATRREEMAAPSLETVLTRRDYRTDALHVVALWARETAPYTLEQLALALAEPRYVLFSGRKSCPLGLPLGPLVIEAERVAVALASRAEQASQPEQLVRRQLRATPGTVAADRDHLTDAEIGRIEFRRDAIAHRGRWQFGLRQEAILKAAEGETP
jgi:CRISPR system Cascade subunit CasD